MNSLLTQDTYLIVLLILSFIRFMGSVIFFDFYMKIKKSRLLFATIGFALFSLNPLIEAFLPSKEELYITYSDFINPIIIPTSFSHQVNRFLYLLADFLSLIAVYLFVIVGYNFIYEINSVTVIRYMVIIISIPFISYLFLPLELAYNFTQLLMVSLVLWLILFVYKNSKEFTIIATSAPVFITFAAIIGLINSLFGIFNGEIPELIELITRVGVSFVLPFVIVTLEYNIIALQRHNMKDKYSHDLGQLLQKQIGRLYFIEVGKDVDNNTTEIKKIYDEIKDLVKLIREI